MLILSDIEQESLVLFEWKRMLKYHMESNCGKEINELQSSA